MRVVHILQGGPTQRIRAADGRIWSFEMHPVCGPVTVNPSTGEPMVRQPAERSSFWNAVHQWLAQGRLVNKTGLCLWSEPDAPKLVHLGGRNYAYAGSKVAKRAHAQKGT